MGTVLLILNVHIIKGAIERVLFLICMTLKSARILYSGLGSLVVKKNPSESLGAEQVKEANGQSKLRFSQVFLDATFSDDIES